MTQNAELALVELAGLAAQICRLPIGVVYWQGKTSGAVQSGPHSPEIATTVAGLCRKALAVGGRFETSVRYLPTFAAVPLFLNGALIGVVAVADDDLAQTLSDDTWALLERIMHAVAGLVEAQWLRTDLQSAQVQLSSLSPFDAITGLRTARALREALPREVLEARRYATPLSLVIFEIDGLAELEAGMGGGAGDELRHTIAGLLRRVRRATDFVAFMGGARFGSLLTHTDERGARRFASRFRTRVDEATWENLSLGVRVGIAVMSDRIHTGDDLLAAAEADLDLSADEAPDLPAPSRPGTLDSGIARGLPTLGPVF